METVLYSVITLGILGIVAGGVLGYAAKRFSIVLDPNIERLVKVLPSSNCGACGYASCLELARALVKGEASSNSCIAGGKDVALKVAAIIGKSAEADLIGPKVAVVQCKGGKSAAKDKFKYSGVEDCKASLLVAGGPKACDYGCLGLGSCVKVCPFDAIYMGNDGIPIVVEDKCTACGKCVKECPRGIIALIPRGQNVYLGCISKDNLKKVKQVCKVGCITCGICVKPDIIPEGLLAMVNNLPEIHWEKGKDLKQLMEQAVKKCPDKCFVIRG